MRLKNLYVVLDARAETLIGNIYHAVTAVPTIRGVQEAANDGTSIIAQHPDDFHILHIGTIDEETGTIRALNGEPLYDKDGRENMTATVTRASALVAQKAG